MDVYVTEQKLFNSSRVVYILKIWMHSRNFLHSSRHSTLLQIIKKKQKFKILHSFIITIFIYEFLNKEDYFLNDKLQCFFKVLIVKSFFKSYTQKIFNLGEYIYIHSSCYICKSSCDELNYENRQNYEK